VANEMHAVRAGRIDYSPEVIDLRLEVNAFRRHLGVLAIAQQVRRHHRAR
jgi:hypothetical protein